MIKKQLVEISHIRFGLYAQPKPVGNVAYLQARQFNEEGRRVIKTDEYIDIVDVNSSHILLDGDVLFVGKGNRLFSWCYREMEQLAVASSIFFVLRPDASVIYPEYLSTILNAPQSKSVFLQLGSGTNILSIRKSELGAFEIPLPAMSEQKKIAALAKLHQEEITLLQMLIEQKQSLFTALISNLIK
jgi:restriction endonuclease S subunit